MFFYVLTESLRFADAKRRVCSSNVARTPANQLTLLSAFCFLLSAFCFLPSAFCFPLSAFCNTAFINDKINEV
jgi:hypothetical protein